MFNETFTFTVPTADVDTKTVVLQVKLRSFFSLIGSSTSLSCPSGYWQGHFLQGRPHGRGSDPPLGDGSLQSQWSCNNQQMLFWNLYKIQKFDFPQSYFQWEELHKLSGKVGHPVLHRQAPPPQRRKSSSSSSSDGEIDTRHNLSLKELNNLLLSYIDQVWCLNHEDKVLLTKCHLYICECV